MILTEKEKNRIRGLHEGTTASASGSYNQPMAFTEPVEVLSMTSEDEDSRIRTIHKENVIVKEQDYTSVNIPEDCLNCVKKALGKYNKKANTISSKIITILADGKVSETEFISGAMTIVKELGDVGSFDMISISSKLWGCKKDCENTELKQ